MTTVWMLLLLMQIKAGQYGYIMQTMGPFDTQVRCEQVASQVTALISAPTMTAKTHTLCYEVTHE